MMETRMQRMRRIDADWLVGRQLISTGHSLVDAYMAFDADEYTKLF